MYVLERDEYAEAHRPGPRWGFWLAWVAITVVAGAVAQPLATSIRDSASTVDSVPVIIAALAGASVGAVLGLSQGLLLLPYINPSGYLQWISATIIGRSFRAMAISIIGLPLLDASADFGSNTNLDLEAHRLLITFCGYWLVSVVIGALAGVPTGFAQSLVLRNRVEGAGRWILATMVASALIYSPIVWAFDISIYETLYYPALGSDSNVTEISRATFIGVITGLTDGVITGIVLIDMLRHPIGQGNWLSSNRRERLSRLIDTTPQPAPEIFTEHVRVEEAKRRKLLEEQGPKGNVERV